MTTAEKIAEHDAWLERNAIRCERYGSRITPLRCEQYQAARPESCKGCDRFAGSGDAVRRHVHLQRKRVAKDMATQVAKGKTAKECKECGRVMKLQGRGLCPKCYYHALKGEAGPVTAKPSQAKSEDHVHGHAQPVAVAPRTESGLSVLLRFDGDDKRLLERLTELAAKDRRSIDNEILCILEAYLEKV